MANGLDVEEYSAILRSKERDVDAEIENARAYIGDSEGRLDRYNLIINSFGRIRTCWLDD